MDWGHKHLILHIHLSPHHPGGGGLSGRPTERGGSYMCTPAEGRRVRRNREDCLNEHSES